MRQTKRVHVQAAETGQDCGAPEDGRMPERIRQLQLCVDLLHSSVPETDEAIFLPGGSQENRSN